MTERERQSEFLRRLLKDETQECRRLRERLQQAEQNEHSIRRALLLMVVIAVFAMVGLGYSAVLLPEFFDNATPFLVKLFCALGLGSVLCMVLFGACWLYYRNTSNQVNSDCRNYLGDQGKGQEIKVDFQQPPVTVNQTPAAVYRIETASPVEDPRIIQFPRAS
jgi:hypothetical protein